MRENIRLACLAKDQTLVWTCLGFTKMLCCIEFCWVYHYQTATWLWAKFLMCQVETKHIFVTRFNVVIISVSSMMYYWPWSFCRTDDSLCSSLSYISEYLFVCCCCCCFCQASQLFCSPRALFILDIQVDFFLVTALAYLLPFTTILFDKRMDISLLPCHFFNRTILLAKVWLEWTRWTKCCRSSIAFAETLIGP